MKTGETAPFTSKVTLFKVKSQYLKMRYRFFLSFFFPGFGRHNSLVVMLVVTSLLCCHGIVSVSSVHFKEKAIWN